jgi:hypothetical protein
MENLIASRSVEEYSKLKQLEIAVRLDPSNRKLKIFLTPLNVDDRQTLLLSDCRNQDESML